VINVICYECHIQGLYAECHYAGRRYAECHLCSVSFMLKAFMLIVILLNVIMLSVMSVMLSVSCDKCLLC
jgi:hypothetical protein